MCFLKILSEVHPIGNTQSLMLTSWWSKTSLKGAWKEKVRRQSSHENFLSHSERVCHDAPYSKNSQQTGVRRRCLQSDRLSMKISQLLSQLVTKIECFPLQPQKAENGDSDHLSWTLLEMLARAISQEKAINSIQTGKKVKHRQKDLLQK